MKCQFCNTEGLLAPAELNGPPQNPTDTTSLVGLKLVSCDFHLHACSFYVCAKCFAAELHLCKQEHPLWESRIQAWKPAQGPKDFAKRERWRFRYTAQDGHSYPAICTRQETHLLFCSQCRTGNVFADENSACTQLNCKGLMRRGCCPACIQMTLPSYSALVKNCIPDTPTFDFGPAIASLMVKAPDNTDIDDYLKLPIQYSNHDDYKITAINSSTTGARRFRICPDVTHYLSGEALGISDNPVNGSAIDVDWPEYMATDLQLHGKNGPIAGLFILLPLEKMTPNLAQNPHLASTSTSGRSKRHKAEPALSELQKHFGGAMVYRPKDGHVHALTDAQLFMLCNGQTTVNPKSVSIVLPPRGKGGSGGALGRADGIGNSGIKHVLLCHNPKSPDCEFSGFSKFLTSARPKTDGIMPPGGIDDVLKAPAKPLATFVPLRTLCFSSLSLYIEVPQSGRSAPHEERALQLLRGRFDNQFKRALAEAAALASAWVGRIDDGSQRGFDWAQDNIDEWQKKHFATFEKNINELESLLPEISHLFTISADDFTVRQKLVRYLQLCRLAVNDNEDVPTLKSRVETHAVNLDTKMALRDVVMIKKHLRDAHQFHAKIYGAAPLDEADKQVLATLRTRLSVQGDPEADDSMGEEPDMTAYMAWWAELWVPPGLDSHWDRGEPEEPETKLLDSRDNLQDPKWVETESQNPSDWPESPDVQSEYWYWNGRPLRIVESVEKTWQLLTLNKQISREYKDTHYFIMRPPNTSRKDDDRDQDTFFDGISATEVAAGLTNRRVAETFRFGTLPPELKLSKPTPAFEWSHLIGDGEGGGIHRSNVISSTRANNTEMLIIETILQQAHKHIADAGLEIVLRVEATLVSRRYELEKDETLNGGIRFTHYQSHVGDWMRYRVWLRKSSKFKMPTGSPTPPCPDMALVLDHILDCQRPRISKATVRVIEYQMRFLLIYTLKTQYGIAWSEGASLTPDLTLGWKNGEGMAKPKPYALAQALATTHGQRLETVPNAGEGNCLFYAVIDALTLLPQLDLQAVLLRAGWLGLPTHQNLRKHAVHHLRHILGFPGPHPIFNGNMNQFGPLNDPCANLLAMQSFLKTYREDYDLAWPFQGYADWDTYLTVMLGDGIWGDMILCTALSHLLGVQIDVYRSGSVIQPILAHELQPPKVIRIYNPSGVHFTALREVPILTTTSVTV